LNMIGCMSSNQNAVFIEHDWMYVESVITFYMSIFELPSNIIHTKWFSLQLTSLMQGEE
jgi:hypothetical protein